MNAAAPTAAAVATRAGVTDDVACDVVVPEPDVAEATGLAVVPAVDVVARAGCVVLANDFAAGVVAWVVEEVVCRVVVALAVELAVVATFEVVGACEARVALFVDVTGVTALDVVPWVVEATAVDFVLTAVPECSAEVDRVVFVVPVAEAVGLVVVVEGRRIVGNGVVLAGQEAG